MPYRVVVCRSAMWKGDLTQTAMQKGEVLRRWQLGHQFVGDFDPLFSAGAFPWGRAFRPCQHARLLKAEDFQLLDQVQDHDASLSFLPESATTCAQSWLLLGWIMIAQSWLHARLIGKIYQYLISSTCNRGKIPGLTAF